MLKTSHKNMKYVYLTIRSLRLAKVTYQAQAAAERGDEVKNGWARKPYFVSKALEIAMTMAFARQHPKFLINACCPGWVQTELGNQAGAAPKTPGMSSL